MNTFFRIRCLGVLNAAMLGLLCQLAWANPECIVAAKPGGGMDVSCKLLQKTIPCRWHGARTCIELFTGVALVPWPGVRSCRTVVAALIRW